MVCVCVQYDHHRVSTLANRLIQKIMSGLPDVIMNGDPEQRYPGTCTHTQNHDGSTKTLSCQILEFESQRRSLNLLFMC